MQMNCVGPRRWVITIVLSGAKHCLSAGCVSTSPHRLLYGGRLHVSLTWDTLNLRQEHNKVVAVELVRDSVREL